MKEKKTMEGVAGTVGGAGRRKELFPPLPSPPPPSPDLSLRTVTHNLLDVTGDQSGKPKVTLKFFVRGYG